MMQASIRPAPVKVFDQELPLAEPPTLPGENQREAIKLLPRPA
jgi:hypothetical protein